MAPGEEPVASIAVLDQERLEHAVCANRFHEGGARSLRWCGELDDVRIELVFAGAGTLRCQELDIVSVGSHAVTRRQALARRCGRRRLWRIVNRVIGTSKDTFGDAVMARRKVSIRHGARLESNVLRDEGVNGCDAELYHKTDQFSSHARRAFVAN
jgi:hypothetical protein